VAPDAPQGKGWLIDRLGREMQLLAVGDVDDPDVGLPVLRPKMNDHIRARYLGDMAAATYLIRPDQVVAARWAGQPDPGTITSTITTILEGRA
jgi:3-(3-hydroxy-phenyl)propionate hydroxylase